MTSEVVTVTVRESVALPAPTIVNVHVPTPVAVIVNVDPANVVVATVLGHPLAVKAAVEWTWLTVSDDEAPTDPKETTLSLVVIAPGI